MVEVIAIGTRVELGPELVGLVLAVLLEANDLVSYKVAWWEGTSRKSEYVTASEIRPLDPNKSKIGYRGTP